jgi:ubiquinone/menaquinone biosynthesis C-methylase UbiE
MKEDLPEHAAENRAYWNGMAHDWVSAGERNWKQALPDWGIWGIAESELQLLPEDMSGMQAIELGCGTGYVSAWMARRGATVTAIDVSEQQLATAQRLAKEHGTPITFIHGSAETVPLPDESFDFAISEYGAAIWCDPAIWIVEAHRLLKPGGTLAFLGTHPLLVACYPQSGAAAEAVLHRSYFDMGKVDWRTVEIEPGGIEFNLPLSEWMALFRKVGFEIVRYHELRAPDAQEEERFGVSAGWAKNWPSEQAWVLRKTPPSP